MSQINYDTLIEKYIDGAATPEEEVLVERFLEENPVNESEILLPEKNEIGRRIKKKLLKNTTRKPARSIYLWAAAIAASLLVFVGASWFFGTGYTNYESVITSMLGAKEYDFELKNTSAKPKSLMLEDGSEVVLQPGSTISYPDHLGDKQRLVYLHGEAFFKVKRNPARPFIVSTENLATQVLGTSFNVKSYDSSGSVEVRVMSGRVSVYEILKDNKETKRNGVILTPNQKIVFDKKSRKMELGIVKNPAVVKPVASRQKFEFSETPVADAFAILEATYGIDIIVEDDVFRNCLFTGDLNDLTMFSQLDLICKAVNADYESRGTSLFIRGEGCLE
ncbi:FecR family protein [Dyadobacter bucti]|uniref:FecR family protein n=1 Tax=Dyadobacter bucti TaxID=2572203 RepID=UPI003F70246F